MKKVAFITTVAVAVLIALGAVVFAENRVAIRVELRSYDVALIALDSPVTKKLDSGKSVVYKRAYLIRLHGDFPVRGARIMRVYFGDLPVQEYGGLPGGIYFMVYEKSALKALAGKELRYQIDAGPVQSFGLRFDPRRFEPYEVMKEKDALLRAAGGS